MRSLLEGGGREGTERIFSYRDAARGSQTEIRRAAFHGTSSSSQFVLSPHGILTKVPALRPASRDERQSVRPPGGGGRGWGRSPGGRRWWLFQGWPAPGLV